LLSLTLCTFVPAQAQLPSILQKMKAERERIAAAKIDTITIVEYAYKGANPEKTGRPDTKLAFDERGNKTLEARLNAKGEVDTKQTFTYNAANVCTEMKSFMEFETLSYTVKHSYNAQNLLTEAVNEDNMSKSGSGRKQVYSYDGSGRLTEMKYLDSKGTVGYRDVYSYDATRREIA
jgi:YD repeat-containing protein